MGLAALGLSLGLSSFSAGNMMPLGCAAIVARSMGAASRTHRMGVGRSPSPCSNRRSRCRRRSDVSFSIRGAAWRWARRWRCLAALSVAGAGWNVTASYVTSVVPAHALSEVSRDNQYSLATIAGAFGVPDTSAALLGSLSYIVMTALGVFVAARLWRRYGGAGLAVLVPPAFSLFGGSFVHTAEIAAAVPAALLLATRSSALRPWCVAALVLLAVPWIYSTSVVLSSRRSFRLRILTYVLWERNRIVALSAACGAFAAIAMLFASPHRIIPHLAPYAHVYPLYRSTASRSELAAIGARELDEQSGDVAAARADLVRFRPAGLASMQLSAAATLRSGGSDVVKNALALSISKDRVIVYGGVLAVLASLPFMLFPSWFHDVAYRGDFANFWSAGSNAGSAALLDPARLGALAEGARHHAAGLRLSAAPSRGFTRRSPI